MMVEDDAVGRTDVFDDDMSVDDIKIVEEAEILDDKEAEILVGKEAEILVDIDAAILVVIGAEILVDEITELVFVSGLTVSVIVKEWVTLLNIVSKESPWSVEVVCIVNVVTGKLNVESISVELVVVNGFGKSVWVDWYSVVCNWEELSFKVCVILVTVGKLSTVDDGSTIVLVIEDDSIVGITVFVSDVSEIVAVTVDVMLLMKAVKDTEGIWFSLVNETFASTVTVETVTE